MSDLTNITKKELRELLTPSSIASILLVVVLFAMIGNTMSGEMSKITSPVDAMIVNEDFENSTYGVDVFIKSYETTYGVGTASEYLTIINEKLTKEQLIEKMEQKGIADAIIIREGFNANVHSTPIKQGVIDVFSIFSHGGVIGSSSSTLLQSVISSTSYNISADLLGEDSSKMNPVKSGTSTYVNGIVVDGVTPSQINNAMSSQNMMVPVIIMVVIIMVGSIVIGSMGNEKENKTLETLLTMPIKRTTIVAGKLIAAGITGLIFGVAYMFGMMMYMKGTSSITLAGVDLASIGLVMDITDWILMLVIMFLAILCALGLCMILGAFTKNYKAAQTMTLPITALAMIPMFILMFMGWESIPSILQGILFVIPFTHPMMAMDNLVFGNMDIVFSGIIYLLIFTVAVILITVKLYKSDILITGLGQNKYVVAVKKSFAKKE